MIFLKLGGVTYPHIKGETIEKYVGLQFEPPNDSDTIDYGAKNIAYLANELLTHGKFFSPPLIVHTKLCKKPITLTSECNQTGCYLFDGNHRMTAYQYLKKDICVDAI